MSENFGNAAFSQLASGIASGATSLSVLTGHGTRFPSPNFRIAVWNALYDNYAEAYRASPSQGEIMLVTSVTSDAFTVTRAQEGTTALDFNPANTVYRVEHVLTAAGVAHKAQVYTLHIDGVNFSGTTHQFFAPNSCNQNGTLSQRTNGGTPFPVGTFQNLRVSAYSTARGLSVSIYCDGVARAVTYTTAAGAGPAGVYGGDTTHTYAYPGSDALPNGGVLFDLYIPTGVGTTAVMILDVSIEFVPA